MSAAYDTVIIGAGLAGLCSALHLCSRERVLVLEASPNPGGSSIAAAGLVNTFMGRKGRPVWRHTYALDALEEVVALADCDHVFDRAGVFRPAMDLVQRERFQHAAHAHLECHYVSNAECMERWDQVNAPRGGIFVDGAGAVDMPAFAEAAAGMLQRRGAVLRLNCSVEAVTGDRRSVCVTVQGGESVHARRVLIAAGPGLTAIAGVPSINIHMIKGQTLEVSRSGPVAIDIPHLAGSGYIVSGRNIIVGSSYEHSFSDLLPDPCKSREILAQGARMVPTLRDHEIIRASAGIRVTVPHRRLPMVGPVPGTSRVWVFTGLGSKGLLLAPLIAKMLPQYFANPTSIPREVAVH